MSNDFWQDGDDSIEDSNAMRVLREKAEADSKVIREMAERLAKMEERESRRALEDRLKTKGLDPKVADLIPKDADPDKWLNDYGTLLKGASDPQPSAAGPEGDVPDGSDDGVPSAEQQFLATAAAAASGAKPPVGLDAVAAKMQEIDDPDALLAFLQSQPGPGQG